MIKKIRLMLEYNTYCIWLYNEKNEIVGNDNPLEWADDKELTDAFMTVSDLYDSFFIDNKREFRYAGCKNAAALHQLEDAVAHAVKLLNDKNNGKYEIINDIRLPKLD